MEPLDRRKMLRMLAGGVTVASASDALIADKAEAIPVSLETNLTGGKAADLIDEAQWRPRRRPPSGLVLEAGDERTVRHLGGAHGGR